jgi:hypothetical protein
MAQRGPAQARGGAGKADVTMEQLPLIEVSQIHCLVCSNELRSLDDLRQSCAKTEGFHQVSTGDYFALYRKSYVVVLA